MHIKESETTVPVMLPDEASKEIEHPPVEPESRFGRLLQWIRKELSEWRLWAGVLILSALVWVSFKNVTSEPGGWWLGLDRLGILFGILTTALAGYAAYSLRRQEKRYLEHIQTQTAPTDLQGIIEAQKGIHTSRPCVLALALLPGQSTILKDVKTYVKQNGWKISRNAYFEITLPGLNSPAELEVYVQRLKDKRNEIEQKGYTEVHLFIAGPVMAGTIAGAILDNWKPVKLHPKNYITREYEYWMPLVK
jgi:hypothetical protein